MKRTPLPADTRRALREGAASLECFAQVYEQEPRDCGLWKRRARDARRHARKLREMAQV